MTTAEYNLCVDEHADGVFRFILKNIKDDEKARDVVQDTFAKMWEKVHDISYEKAKSYLFTAAYHTMIDAIRKENKQTSFDDVSYDISGSSYQFTDVKEVIDAALQKLPDVQKSALLLRDYEGYSYQEIGEILNLNESQVKVYIYRARLSMKNYLVSVDNVL
jgi:RNA polymerase sigma-70 factor (ECF subfamily)